MLFGKGGDERGPNILFTREALLSWTPLWILYCIVGHTEQG